MSVSKTMTVLAMASGVFVSADWAYAQFGVPITDPAPLNNNAASDSGSDQRAQIATDGAGNWVVVWESDENLGGTIGTDADILVSRSVDNGVTWTVLAPLNTNAATDGGVDVDPQLAADGSGNWIAVWTSGDSLGGTIGADLDILFAVSTNKGATWTSPTPLNTNASSDTLLGFSDNHPQIATDGLGNWVTVWDSDNDLGGTIDTDRDILFARSTNKGATWTAPAILNTNAATDGHFDVDVDPQVTADGQGNWVVAWELKADSADRDVLFCRSTDNGATWSAPAPLNSNAASDTGDDFAPQVTTDGAGNWIAVWFATDDLGGTIGTDGDILVARSSDNAATWTAPAPLNTNAATDSRSDEFPQATTDGSGNWVAVWDSTDNLGGTIGIDADILVSRSADNGVAWTPPAPLNTNAATDSGADFFAQIATDGLGNWVAVWSSNNTLDGTIGFDNDILVARFVGFGVCGNGIVEPGEACDDGNLDDTDFCLSTCEFNTAIPTVSTWGLIVLTLLMLTAGTLIVMRRCLPTDRPVKTR